MLCICNYILNKGGKQMKSINFIKKLRKGEAIAISETENIKRLTAEEAMIKPVFIFVLFL